MRPLGLGAIRGALAIVSSAGLAVGRLYSAAHAIVAECKPLRSAAHSAVRRPRRCDMVGITGAGKGHTNSVPHAKNRGKTPSRVHSGDEAGLACQVGVFDDVGEGAGGGEEGGYAGAVGVVVFDGGGSAGAQQSGDVRNHAADDR